MTEALLVLAFVITAVTLVRVIRGRRTRARVDKKPDPVREMIHERTQLFERERDQMIVLYAKFFNAPGTMLRLHADGRSHLLGKMNKYGEYGYKYSLKREVRNWCRQYCEGSVVVVPHIDHVVERGVVHFANENDAFMFKMRWY